MFDLGSVKEFEWDEGNTDKSYQKHGITQKESEELFIDENILFLEDVKHSQKEKRFIAIGKTILGKILFAVFTVRKSKMRIISVRLANKKERKQYNDDEK